MTAKKEKKQLVKYFSVYQPFIISLTLTFIIMFAAVFLSDELSEYAKNGFLLSIKVIVPSVFPFLILTDLVIPHIKFEKTRPLRKIFEKCFKISGCGIPALVCGLICGFPIGARLAISLYKCGKISLGECERLMAFSNNASPGYVISALGIGIRGSLKDGIIIYFSVIISAVISGMLVGKKGNISVFSDLISEDKYDFVESVKDSVNVCLNICGFVTVFSVLTGLIQKLIKNNVLLCIILPFIEIGNAGVFLAQANFLSEDITLILTAFATAFSGLSVYAQTRGSLNTAFNFSFKKYLFIKLLQGSICALCVAAILLCINNI